MAKKKKQLPVLPAKIAKAVVEKAASPQLADSFARFVHRCGGPVGFGDKLFEVFDSAEPGSRIQQGIMDMVVRMGRFVNEREKQEDMGNLTDDDLVNHLGVLWQRVNGHAPTTAAGSGDDEVRPNAGGSGGGPAASDANGTAEAGAAQGVDLQPSAARQQSPADSPETRPAAAGCQGPLVDLPEASGPGQQPPRPSRDSKQGDSPTH